jgi:hypothetical protein
MTGIESVILVFIALAPFWYYLGLILNNGLRDIPVLGPVGRIVGAVCYLAAGAGGLVIAGALTLLILGGLMAGGTLVLLVLVPLMCLAILVRFVEPHITRAMASSSSE